MSEYARFCVIVNTQSQCLRNGQSDAFRCRLCLAITDMGVAHRHARLLVAKQARDHRQRNALQNGVAGYRVSERS